MAFIPDSPVVKKKSSFIPDQRSLGGFAENVGKSAVSNLSGMVEGIAGMANPNVDNNTLYNLGRLAQGGLQKLDPTKGKVIANTISNATPLSMIKRVDEMRGVSTDYRPQADAVGQFYKDRYGGVENIKRSAYEDPVGVALDASIVLGGGGAGLKGLGALSKSSKLAKAGQIASKVGRIIDPVSTAGKGLGKIGSAIKPKIVGVLEGMSEGYATSGLGDPKLLKEIQGVTGKKTSQLMREYELFDRSPSSASRAIEGLDTTMTSKIQGAPKGRIDNIIEMFDNTISKLKNESKFSDVAKGELEDILRRRDDFLKYIDDMGVTKKTFSPEVKNHTPIKVRNKVDRYVDIKPEPNNYTPIEYKYKGWKNQKIVPKYDTYTPIKIKTRLDKYKVFTPENEKFTKLNIRKYKELPTEIEANKLLEIKRKIGKDISDSKFSIDASQTAKSNSAKKVYNIFKDQVNELAGTKQLGRDEAGLIKLKDIFKNAEARGQSRQALGLKDFMAGGAGGVIGGVPGAIGGIALRQFLDSPKGIQIVTEMLQKGAGGVNKMKMPNIFKKLIEGSKYERVINPK